MRIILIYGAALLAAGVIGCGEDDAAGGDAAAQVVATTPLVADLARNVGEGRAEVRAMLAANADPHDYEPKPSDAAALADADLVLRSGGDLDEWLGELVDSVGTKGEVVSLSEGDDEDPHWWHDPAKAVAAVHAIRDALADADPDGSVAYARNAKRYEGKIRALDAAIQRCMGRVPVDERKLVTTHDALGHFAKRYGIEVIGSVIPSLSTAAQPSAGETAELIEQIKREGVRVVFSESSVSSKIEEAIAREAGAEVGDELWADGLGPEDSAGATYLQAMASNADAMARGFTDGAVACDGAAG